MCVCVCISRDGQHIFSSHPDFAFAAATAGCFGDFRKGVGVGCIGCEAYSFKLFCVFFPFFFLPYR